MTERARILRKDALAAMRADEKARQRAQEEAAQILKAARREAEADADAIRQDARTAATREAAAILDAANATAQREIAALEAEVSTLVASTLRKVIGTMDQSEAIKAATKTALARLASDTAVKLRAAPEVYPVVQAALEEEAAEGRALAESVAPDPRLSGTRVIASSARGHTEIGIDDLLEAASEPWVNLT